MTGKSSNKNNWIFHALGASNTSGYGGTFAFDKIIRYVLEVHSAKNKAIVQEIFKQKKVYFLLDYFYPTRFPYFSKNFHEQIPELVENSLSRYLTEEYEIFLAPLPKTESILKYTEKIENTNILQILKSVEENEKDKARDIINDKLLDISLKSDNIHMMNLNQWFAKLSDPLFRYNINIVEKWKSQNFFSENRHFNDYGQFLVVNDFIIPELERIFKNYTKNNIRFQRYPMSNLLGNTWRNRVLKSLFSTNLNIEHGGNYFVTVENSQSIWTGGNLQPAKPRQNFAVDYFLKYKSIQALIIFFFMTAKKTAELDFNQDSSELILDLTKILTFVPVKMHRVKTNDSDEKYIGYGYDFWTSINNEITNYRFQASVDRELKIIKIVWDIFPKIEGQTANYVRKGFLETVYIDYINKHENDLDKLSYSFDLKIKSDI